MLWGTMAVLELVALSVALSNKTYIDKSNELVNREEHSDLETFDNGEKGCKKEKKEEREAKQLQFSRLMERFHDMWANSPFSYEAERARIEKIRAERGQRRPSNTQRYSNRREDNKEEEDEKKEEEEANLTLQRQRLLQVAQQQEITRQQQLLQQQQQFEQQLVEQQAQQQQHLQRLLALRQRQSESQQHHQWLFPDLARGPVPVQKKRLNTNSSPSRPVEKKVEEECCLFLFLDGSAHYFDTFLKVYTGQYQLQTEKVNGHPYYSNRECSSGPGTFSATCQYIWRSGGRWIVGEGRYVGQNKGVMYTSEDGRCPHGLLGWRYLDSDMNWRDKRGKISLECTS